MPADGQAVEVHRVHPFQAVKRYTCPGCHQEIHAGSGHVVVFPAGKAQYRRHWHRSCWDNRSRRRPGR